MYAEANAILEFSLMTVSSVFFIVDPFATTSAFVVVTEHDSAIKRARMARQAARTWSSRPWPSRAALSSRCSASPWLHSKSPADCCCSSLPWISFRRGARNPGDSREREAASEIEEVGISSIGIPMLAGPGAISAL